MKVNEYYIEFTDGSKCFYYALTVLDVWVAATFDIRRNAQDIMVKSILNTETGSLHTDFEFKCNSTFPSIPQI